MNPKANCITVWFPTLCEIGIPVPKTVIVELPENLSGIAYGEPIERIDEYIEMIANVCDQIGYPCFLRSGQTSAKHYWQDACFLPSRNDIPRHVSEIVEYSEMAGIMGLPSDVWAARELLPTVPLFTAFPGNMPIVREFRFFVQDGEVCHVQPYWPADSIRNPSVENWQELLADASVLSVEERALLTSQTERIGAALGGYWSVDWLQVGADWYCTDMAQGAESFKYDPVEAEAPGAGMKVEEQAVKPQQESPQKCCCPHWEAITCYVHRYGHNYRDREEAEMEARCCGGCSCACHMQEEDDDVQWE